MSRTLSLSHAPDDRPSSRRTARLVRVLECGRPASGGSSHVLDGLGQVSLGRTESLVVERREKSLTLGFPDERASSQHAVLRFEANRWVLEDTNSKNGTRVNGVPQKRALLNDGDWVEVGYTHLRFLVGEADDAAAADVVLGPDGGASEGLRTFSPRFAKELRALAKVAPTTVPVLVRGPTGTGKELAARATHMLSGRSGPLVPVNCGALSPALVEGELFGYRRGAFTGAHDDRVGLVRSAANGTLLLDEVGDLPLQAQPALLRVLQEKEVAPLGGKPVATDVRVVAATHQPLERLVAAGTFREDLFARLSGFTLALPPLADRREDLGLLLASLLRRHAGPAADGVRLTHDASRALLHHPWPLNVRQLEQVLTVALSLAQEGRIGLPELKTLTAAPQVAAAPEVLDAEALALRTRLLAELAAHRGNVTQVAKAMGKGRTQIQRWLKRFAIDPRHLEE